MNFLALFPPRGKVLAPLRGKTFKPGRTTNFPQMTTDLCNINQNS